MPNDYYGFAANGCKACVSFPGRTILTTTTHMIPPRDIPYLEGPHEEEVAAALAAKDYAGALAALAKLREPIDAFFDDVLVMDPDEAIKNNHLRLLNKFAQTFADVADIGLLSLTLSEPPLLPS